MYPVKDSAKTMLPHFAIWGLLLLAPMFVRIPPHREIDFTNLPGYIFFGMNLLNIGLFYLVAIVIYPRYMNRKKWLLFALLAGSTLGVVYLFKMAVIRFGFPDIPRDFNTHRFAFFSTFLFLVASIIYQAIRDNNRRNRELREAREAQLISELKFLRSQVSPHFLFNVLTNLVSLARSGSKQLEPSLIRLSDLMRYMLYDSAEKKVTIAGEMQYLKSYIELQKLRFGDDVNIKADFDIDDQQEHLAIEPMLLIPFVENAFKHGVGWIDKPAISIHLSLSQGILGLSVRNKYNEQERSGDPHSGIGLANVQSRLNLMYPGRHLLSRQRIDDSYFVHLSLELL